MRLLVTGFPKFDKYAENSTQTLIASILAESPPELESLRGSVAFEIVEFDNEDSASQQKTMLESLHMLLKKHDPSVCLFCGQAASRPWITLETIAINVFKGELIDPNGPAAYWATLPGQEALVEAMQSEGIPAKLSHHAGIHLCNHILYTGLRHAKQTGSGMTCGFLHLPMTNTQVISGEENRPFVPLSMTRRALVLAIEHVHRQLGLRG
ncbi:hypothetical protein JW848_01515 [Candidatus Bipolaricaulota bacterium]|nr:hypothetical protein [Candidatus Bipolaricaulota bacterium]